DGHQIPERTRSVEFGRKTRRTSRTRDVMPPRDVAPLMTVLETHPERARWLLALVAGMRPAEVRGLTWESVDLSRGVIVVDWQLQPLPYNVPRDRSSGFRVPRDFEAKRLHDAYHLVRPKTASGERVVPLTAAICDALADWRERAPQSKYGLVFCR